MFSYGSHGHQGGHRGGGLDHQVGMARVTGLGHHALGVVGGRHSYPIGDLPFRLVLNFVRGCNLTPCCCMDGRRAHCWRSVPGIFCVIGPTWSLASNM